MSHPDPDGRHVVLLATGGTIASRQIPERGQGSIAADTGEDLLRTASKPSPFPVRVVDVFQRGSYSLTFEDMLAICAKITEVLLDPQVAGVVVSHGTDTMEETAFLADLVHADQRPVVFTGAQFSADSALPDGPGNLLQAVAVAAAPAAAGHGVLLSFAGKVFRARGVRKAHTRRLDAFANPDFGIAGTVSPEGIVAMDGPERHPAPLPLPTDLTSARQRVDLVCSYPGADAVLVQASVAAGAAGIVLQGTGSGNANPVLCNALQEAIASGVTVVTSTRVDAGPVVPVYGAGGGLDLETAGAIPSGSLRPSQSLILLSLLLHLRADSEAVSAAFAEHGLIAQPATNY